ncbi:hypothetical protein [Streptosporangium carneum]|uniref:Uncharacterized protein n=1 Tax=Streptosporangium carneum TaxID=47481 RepID=A0A9W6I715_9ACTN|nr:hypothetical protein [Streptosporangium carneum]GLK13231.1 hypothetical protein GCM10017600_66420 [Streptosporangium carneum]
MSVTDQELVTELRELADHPHLTARQDQLRDLADAITDPDKAGRWCEIDLFDAFSPDDTILVDGEPAKLSSQNPSSQKKPRRRRRLGAAVGPALVFVPIFITWLGLMMATGAYGDVLDADGLDAARRPFLEMWQRGFDGRLPDFFKFDNIALCTLAAIFCLIFWTVFENVTKNGREEAAERDLAALRVRLRGALTQASLVLGGVRLSSPARFGTELSKTAADIGSVGAMARKVHTELVEALTLTLDATRKTTDALTTSAIDVRDGVELLGKQLATINSTCDDLTGVVARASAMIDNAGSRTGQAVTKAGNQLSTTISQTTLDMRRAFNDELVRSVRSVQGTVSGLDTRIDKLVDATMSIGYAVDRAAVSIDAVGSTTEKAVDLLGERVTDTLVGAAEDFRRTFGNTSGEIREALGDWSATAGAHASRIERASDASGRTITLLEQTRDTLDRLPSTLGGVLAELPTRGGGLADGEVTDLKQAIVRLQLAVDRAASTFEASPRDTAQPGQSGLAQPGPGHSGHSGQEDGHGNGQAARQRTSR